MADNHDTLDFFGRLENRLALVATMNAAQGQRLVNLAEASADPVAGNLANELEALRMDVAAAVDELRKMSRHMAAVEALTLPAAALAQQMQADAQTRANVVADRRTWPATWADGLAAAGRPDKADAEVERRRQRAAELAAELRAGFRWDPVTRMALQDVAAAPAVDLSALPGLRDMAEAQRMEVVRQLLELRGQGRLVDAQELAGSDLLEQAELQARALANLASAPALVSLDVLDEISARATAMLGRLRQLVDTDARRQQMEAFSPAGPVWPEGLG